MKKKPKTTIEQRLQRKARLDKRRKQLAAWAQRVLDYVQEQETGYVS